MRLIKLSLVAALVTTLTFAADFTKDIGVSANVAMTSNYVWRGTSQTDDSPAIQGGFDLDYKGVYAGLWGSNVEYATASLEADIYFGYADEVSNFSYDIGFIQYTYPNQVDANNFGEIYAGVGYELEATTLNAKYSLGIQTDDSKAEDYIEIDAQTPLLVDFTVAAHFGIYTNIGKDYSIGASKSLGKIDFDLSYVGFTADSDTNADDQDNIVLTVGTSF